MVSLRNEQVALYVCTVFVQIVIKGTDSKAPKRGSVFI